MIGSNVILPSFIGNYIMVRAPRELGPTSMPYFHRRIRCHLITTSMRRRADTVYIYDASSRSKFKTLRKLREKVVDILENQLDPEDDITELLNQLYDLAQVKFDINFVFYFNQM